MFCKCCTRNFHGLKSGLLVLSNLFQSPIWIYPPEADHPLFGGPEIIRFHPFVHAGISGVLQCKLQPFLAQTLGRSQIKTPPYINSKR